MNLLHITKNFTNMKTLNLKLVGLWIVLALLSSCSDDLSTDQQLAEEPKAEIEVHDHRTCNHDSYMEHLLSDPEYKAAYDKRMAKYKDYVTNVATTRALCSNPTIVPVAVHYQGATSVDVGCLNTLAVNAIAALNADFQGTNADINSWTGNAASSFPGINYGEACLQFVLANQNHPSGYGLTNGDLAVTINATTGDSDNNWSGYLNIFVKNAGGALGYSPLGGAGNGDGVVVSQSAFGTGANCGNIGSNAPFNLGRTLTHELGHYLLLDRIWGNGCNQDDGVADTPNSAQEYYGCSAIGASSCGSTDLHMNYMDYSDDACMYMFTEGQATVTENYVASSLSNITNNAASVINGTTTTGGGGTTGTGGTGTGGTGSGGTGGGTSVVCTTPASTDTELLSSSSVKVTWEAQPTAEKYQVFYRVQGTTSWTVKSAVIAEKTLASLAPSTTYQYRVRTKCPSGWTPFTATETFQTTGGGGTSTTCGAPTTSSVEVQTETTAKVTWEAMPQATRYQIRYRTQGGGSWTNRISTIAQRTLTGLQNGATYEYKIRTRCPSGWTSFSGMETFVQSLGAPTGGGSNLNTVNFNLILDDYGSETSWELEDANGSVVANGGPYGDGNNGMLVTEMFSLEDGCYILFVDDAYGDGICCAYGSGSFEITDINGTQVGYSNGNFGNYDYIEFCVVNNVVTFRDEQKDEKELNLAPKSLNPINVE
jgi:hypothetical protein